MGNLTALVDCDNFYASCERIFNPKLKNRAVIVLSNNDGCVIARSQEIKDMGIKMGTPYYQIKSQIQKNNIAVFSSNYELYGDISSRVMSILSQFTSDLEVYSIDEAFLELPEGKTEEICKEIIQRCRKWLGVPVKIGVSHTKSLSKVASNIVKKEKIPGKYKVLTDKKEIDAALDNFPVEDVWGIGNRTARKLNHMGIYKTAQLLKLSENSIRSEFGVTLQRTAMELKGIKCFDIETNPPSKKSICFSRSFGHTITKYQDLRESIATYASEAAVNLRTEKSKAQSITVFILTNRFNETLPQYANSCSLSIPNAANDTFTIVKYAEEGLRRIYREGYMYKKSGIILNDLIPETIDQPDFFETPNPKHQALSKAMDEINSKYGRNTIVIASAGLDNKNWEMSRKLMSGKFTTRWEELPEVN